MKIRALFFVACGALVACGAGINTGDDEPSTSQAGASAAGSSGQMARAGSTSTAGRANGGASSGASGRGGMSASGGAGASGAPANGGGGAGNSAGGNPGGAPQGGKGGASSAGAAGAGATDQGGAASGFAIDYSIWQLQLPTGDFIQPNALKSYSDQWFKKASDGGQLFIDPSQGAATGGSDHARTELREMKTGVGAAWSASGTNTLTVSGKAIKASNCTIGQIFHSDIATLAELQYSSASGGSMKLLYEEEKGSAEAPKDLGVKVPLGSTYTFVLSLTKKVLTVTVNGHVGYTRTPSSSVFSPDEFYFKAGNYDQTTSTGAVSNDVSSQIEDYSVAVVHQ